MTLDLKTFGQIADDLGLPPHQTKYAIDKSGARPVTRVAGTRLFDQAAVEQIRATAARIAAKRRQSATA
ncbi:MAG: hypothetical protein AAGD32_06680 [Planctomycetota bacterium]